MQRSIGSLILAILILVPTARAATITVDGSGGGDYQTIAEGLAAATDGDVIQISSGTYNEFVVVNKSVEFVGSGAPGSVILSGMSSHGIFSIFGEWTVGISGLTFQDASVPDAGGAIDARFGPTVIINECRFVNNQAGWDAGAIHARHTGTKVAVMNSQFEGNYAAHNGGAANVILNGNLEFSNCSFRENRSGSLSGAVASDTGATLKVDGCLFAFNQGRLVGAILVRQSIGVLTGNTLHGNAGGLGSIDCVESPEAVVNRNIISGNQSGYGLMMEYIPVTHACNLFWDNIAGAVAGGPLSADEVIADPQFCDVSAGDFSVAYISSATADNSACGELIGAFPPACDLPASQYPFWAEFVPQTLNLASNGKWITATLESARDIGVDQIELASLAIEGVVPAESAIEDGRVVAKFPRQEVGALLPVGMAVPVTLAGRLLDGTSFSASDTIRVIDPARASKALTAAKYSAGAMAEVEWLAIVDDTSTRYDGYISMDGGVTWSSLFAGLRGANRYSWVLPTELTGSAEVLVEARARHGVYHAMTKRFTIDGASFESADPGATGFSVTASPNPFNPRTTLHYTLPTSGKAELVVYDLAGRRIKTLFSGYVEAGANETQWDGRDEQGRFVASGVYLYHLAAGPLRETKRMVLLK